MPSTLTGQKSLALAPLNSTSISVTIGLRQLRRHAIVHSVRFVLLAQFTTASLLGSMSTAYDGNPRDRSLDSSEPFAFINFYGSAGTTWNKIVLTNNSSSGFEADNFTVRQSTYNPATDGPVLPGVPVARVTGTQTTQVAPGAKGAALWGSTSAIPGAPAPPFAMAAAFGVAFFFKGRKRNNASANA